MAPALGLCPCLQYRSQQPIRIPNPNPNPNPNNGGKRFIYSLCRNRRRYAESSSPILSNFSSSSSSSSSPPHSLRYAVLGAGFAGLSVAWHLLKQTPKDSCLRIDIFDEVGIGGGASGISGGLLHPYSPKVKLLWRGAECWRECLKLLAIAERVGNTTASDGVAQDSRSTFGEQIVWRRGILRPATTLKNAEMFKENAQSCLGSCRLELLDKDAAQNLVPDICLPFNSAVYMPLAMNIHPKRYLQALFLACKNLADDLSKSGGVRREVNLCKNSVNSLIELNDEYNAVIICLGANVDMLPELAGKLPLRTCRGVVAHMQLPNDIGAEHGTHSPSILSDAWLAIQGPHSMVLGSTWEWKSRNYSSSVTAEEASAAAEELLPKACAVYPGIRRWSFVGASGGLRAMPPVTPLGSLPLLGCVDDAVGNGRVVGCKYWLVGGLGSRGLLYHGLLGNLTAQAVVSCDEGILPSELTSWKKIKRLKEAR